MRAPPLFRRLARTASVALGGLFDQSQPFGRLALVHALQAAGSGLIAISLAGSLFFSISPDAAKGKVLLYLVLTIAPFAVVGPTLSPLLDRHSSARRSAVAVANAGSALFCLSMARNIHDLWLFPEAFALLVLAKLYLVTKAALVPQMTAPGDDLATTNAKLAVIASLAGFTAVPFGVLLLKIGAPWVLLLAALVFGAGTLASFRLARPGRDPAEDTGPSRARTVPPRLSEVREQRRVLGLPLYPFEVVSAISAVSVARATVGFVEFFLAFGFRRTHAATWWFGILLVASAVGSLAGSLLVPPARRRLSERQIIIVALLAVTAGASLAFLFGGRSAQILLALAVGLAPTSAKPALDSIVQHHVPPALLGRAFGRLETRLQLTWVLAALIAVVIPFPLRLGDGVVALAALLAAVSYATSGVVPRRSPSSGRPPARRARA